MFKWLLFLLNTPFLLDAADDTGGGDLEDIDVLGEGDDKDDDKDKEDKDDDKEDKEEDEEDEGEEGEEEDTDEESDEDKESEDKEDKEEDDEEDEDNEADAEARLTHYSDIKKEFPTFFKKFPDIRAALFRDQEYGRILGSPKDAETAVKRSGTLDQVEDDIFVKNDISELLKTIQNSSKESFAKIGYDFLNQVEKLDKDLYYEIAAVPIKRMLRAAWAQGEGQKTNLGKAAAYIHHYFFENYDFKEKTKAELDIKPEGKSRAQTEYEDRLKKLDEREHNNFAHGVGNSYMNTMTKFVLDGLKDDDRLSQWSKNKLSEEVLTEIKKQLDADSRYQNQMDSLWKQAKSDGYTNASKTRIINVALARAKALAPKIRTRLVAEALGKGTKSKENKEGKEKETTHRRSESRESRFGSRRENKPSKTLTDLDILRGH